MTISVLSFQAICNPPLRLPFSTFNHQRPSRNFVVCSAKPVVPPALKHTAAARIESLSQVSGVLASQWGNEGKENLVEILAPHFDIVAIYQGGASIPVTFHNFKGKKIALDLIPSGILNEDTICVIGNGVAVHVPRLVSEIDYLESNGVSCKGRILISDRAPLLFDFQQQVNELCDYFIGSALAGLGPCYANKVIRNGIRVSDLRHMDTFPQKLDLLLSDAAKMVENFDYDAAILVEKFDYGPCMLKKQVEKYKRYAERLEPFIADTVHLLNEAITQKKKVLVVGEEATMFDIDFGTYPIVTTSSTSAGGICTGLGIAPRLVGDLIGVVKAYTPKFGIGPFPTEVLCGIGPPTPTEMVEAYKAKYGIGHFPTENWSLERYQLRHSVSKELGNHARLAQRCGWLDIVALKYSCQINGFSSLYLSRLDVLSDLDKIQLGVSYKHYDGTPIQSFPADLDLLKQLKVEYEVFPGWRSDISSIRNYSDLPKAAQQYVERIEELVGVPIHYIGVGPGRDDVIFK